MTEPHTDPDRSRRPSLIPAAILWILAGLVYAGGEAVAASAFPGYSYATNYISDLGVTSVGSFQGRFIDSPLSAVMNSAFVLQGALFATAALIAVRAVRAVRGVAGASGRRAVPVVFAVLALVHGIGITVVGLIHGSAENAANGLGIFHVLGAALAIIGGNLAAITAGLGAARIGASGSYRVVSVVLGVVGLLALVMLEVDSGSTQLDLLADGVWERASVYTITVWEVVTGVALLVARSGRRGAVANFESPARLRQP